MSPAARRPSPRPSPGVPGEGASVRRPATRPGLALIPLLTLVAMLMIGLAFVVSMARHVRSTSANELTRKRMSAIAEAIGGLAKQGVDATVPLPAVLLNADRAAHEPPMRDFAGVSSRAIADRLTGGATAGPGGLARPALPAVANAVAGATLATAVPELRDAWGTPIALMPGQHPEIGMAPDDAPFLVSAGPDGCFLTLGDNLYSYDLQLSLPRVSTTRPTANAK